MKAGVITFPGSNCDDDLVFVLTKVGFSVDRLWHKDTPDLSAYDLVALPGGFSYGDYLRCGAIAALSPIMESVKRFANQGGLVLGVCNGFQTLCELGLLPGALAKNKNLNFICKDVWLKIETNTSPWSKNMKAGDRLLIPMAHGDGRYVVSDEEYQTLKNNDQVVMSYCNADGKTDTQSNPNGSAYEIAGVCNDQKNVFGLMPHPERATDLRSRDGQKFFNSIVHFLNERAK